MKRIKQRVKHMTLKQRSHVDPRQIIAELNPVLRGVVELVADLPADPRIAYLALALLADFGKLQFTSAKLWRRLLDAVEHHGDPSCIAPLAAVEPRDPAAVVRMTNIGKRLTKATELTAEQLAELRTEKATPPSTNGGSSSRPFTRTRARTTRARSTRTG